MDRAQNLGGPLPQIGFRRGPLAVSSMTQPLALSASRIASARLKSFALRAPCRASRREMISGEGCASLTLRAATCEAPEASAIALTIAERPKIFPSCPQISKAALADSGDKESESIDRLSSVIQEKIMPQALE